LNVDKKSKITRYVVSSAMVVNALAAPVAVFAAEESGRPDEAQAAIKELMDKAIMVGDDKGQLNLEGKLTRAQVAAILARSLSLDSQLPYLVVESNAHPPYLFRKTCFFSLFSISKEGCKFI